jgi:hypothetical protein
LDDADEWERVEEVVSARLNLYTFQNDIAVARIAKGRNSDTSSIRPAVKLPTNDAECLIFGYGSDNFFEKTKTSDVVRYARVNLISFEQCEEILGRVSAPIVPQQFCAVGTRQSDGCYGKVWILIYFVRFDHKFHLQATVDPVCEFYFFCGEVNFFFSIFDRRFNLSQF